MKEKNHSKLGPSSPWAALAFVAVLAVAAVAAVAGCAARDHAKDVADAVGKIEWYGISSMRIALKGKIVYIDPYRARDGEKADIILITHLHKEHFDYGKIRAMSKPGTVVVAPYPLGIGNRVLKPGKRATIQGVRIEAIAAYEPESKAYHLKLEGNAGYVITFGGVRVYHAGPTDVIPELAEVCSDIAILSDDTARKAGESAKIAISCGASVVIPIDHSLISREPPALEAFRAALGSSSVSIAVPALHAPAD